MSELPRIHPLDFSLLLPPCEPGADGRQVAKHAARTRAAGVYQTETRADHEGVSYTVRYHGGRYVTARCRYDDRDGSGMTFRTNRRSLLVLADRNVVIEPES